MFFLGGAAAACGYGYSTGRTGSSRMTYKNESQQKIIFG